MNPIRARARLQVLRRWVAPVILAALVAQWAGAGTGLAFAVMLCAISGLAVWYGWRGMAHLLHHLRLRMAGHVATATITGYRTDDQSDDQPHVALVSFVTDEGADRRLVPLTTQYEDPPPGAGDAASAATQSNTPPIGHVLRVVYDPADPTWVDARIGWPMLGLSALLCVIMVAWLGTVVIATIAVEIAELARH